MIKEIRLPEVSENVESGEISKILVSVGDVIEVDQSIVEMETDKAVFEVPSTVRGKVTEILVKAGSTIKVGETILKVEEMASSEATAKPEPQPEPKTETSPAPEVQKKPEPVADKIPEKKVESKPQAPPPTHYLTAPAAPSVRRAARELGVDIHTVKGSGTSGRISLDDVKLHVKQTMEVLRGSPEKAAGLPIAHRPLPDFSRWGEIEVKPMNRVRRLTAEGTSYAWQNAPHVFQFDKADITELEKWRKKNLKRVENAGGSLTVTAILIKVCALALRTFPQFNSSIDLSVGTIIYKNFCHIGLAVDTERGLLVPVVQDADKKSIIQIAIESGELAQKARDSKISPAEMEGGCFTISNLGGIGGTAFTPIVNWPQVSILGVARAQTEAVFQDGQFVPRLMLPLTLSYDHRVIDGADGARFIRWIVEALENPLSILLN